MHDPFKACRAVDVKVAAEKFNGPFKIAR